MVDRVTSQTMMRSAQRNLQTSVAQLAKVQNMASSLAKISKPSDDPIGTANSMRVRAEQRAVEQHSRNINDANGWLTTVDTALSSTTSILLKVRDLTVQGANDGAMSATAKEAIAIEIESLRAELMNVANRQYTGRSVFAGTSSAGVAVDSTYAFAATQEVTRRIGSDSTVRVDADGASLFGSGDESVFALLDNIARDLREGTNVNSRITEIDARRTTVLGAQAAVGARQAQVDRADEINSSKSVSLEAERSDIEDIDLAKVILDLQLQENTYQAALAVTARVLQPTLMDFLR